MMLDHTSPNHSAQQYWGIWFLPTPDSYDPNSWIEWTNDSTAGTLIGLASSSSSA